MGDIGKDFPMTEHGNDDFLDIPRHEGPIPIHTDVETALRGLDAYSNFVSRLPSDLAIKVDMNASGNLRGMYLGIFPEMEYGMSESINSSFTEAEFSIISGAVNEDPEYRFLPGMKRFVNIPVAIRVARNAGPDIFPGIPDMSDNELEQRILADLETGKCTNAQYGALSGYPPDDAEKYEKFKPVIELLIKNKDIGISRFAKNYWTQRRFIHLLSADADKEWESIFTKTGISDPELRLLCKSAQGYSIGKDETSQLGFFYGFSEESRKWADQLDSIYTTAVSMHSLGKRQIDP